MPVLVTPVGPTFRLTDPDAVPTLDAPARDLVTALRDEATRAAPLAPEALARQLYGELRRMARGHRARWRGNATMNTTALVHEAYLRAARGPASGGGSERDNTESARGFEGEDHFLGVASRAMRHVLINYARDRSALKRGSGIPDVPLAEAPASSLLVEREADDLLELDSALDRLAAMDTRAARVVELKFYGGLTLDETADALGISEATVTRDWRRARAWLYGELRADLPTLPRD